MLRNFGCRKGEPIFQGCGGKRKGGNQNFPKILGGTKALHTMDCNAFKSTLQVTDVGNDIMYSYEWKKKGFCVGEVCHILVFVQFI